MSQFTMMNTLLQTRVDDQLRGRVMSIYALTFFGFAPFGNLAIGALSESDRPQQCHRAVCGRQSAAGACHSPQSVPEIRKLP